jgi:hypothetical protein
MRKLPNPRRSHGQTKAEVTLPAPSEPVTIVGPHGERIPGRVTESNGDGVDVALMFRPARPLRKDQLKRLALEFTLPRGRVRLQGDVQLEGRDLLHFGDLKPVEVRQEREYVRVPSSRPVTISIDHGPSKVLTYSVDLSGGGILLAGPSTLQIGERVPFELTIAKGQAPISGVGVVVRADSESRRAIRFERISDVDRRRLVRFIFECMRLERRRELQRGDRGGS